MGRRGRGVRAAMIIVCFYRHRGAGPLLTELATRTPGQPLRDVPSHVGVWLSGRDAYYEAVWRGVRRLDHPPVPWRTLPLPAMDEASADTWLAARVGWPYDWAALAYDLVGLGLPRWTTLGDDCATRYDCSRLAQGALIAAGLRHELSSRLPETPNDLWCALSAMPARACVASRNGVSAR